jgi:hypothetical protein
MLKHDINRPSHSIKHVTKKKQFTTNLVLICDDVSDAGNELIIRLFRSRSTAVAKTAGINVIISSKGEVVLRVMGKLQTKIRTSHITILIHSVFPWEVNES